MPSPDAWRDEVERRQRVADERRAAGRQRQRIGFLEGAGITALVLFALLVGALLINGIGLR